MFIHDGDAVALLGGAYAAHTAAAGFAGVAALAIAELIKHDRGFCRVHKLFALPRLVFGRPCGVYTQ